MQNGKSWKTNSLTSYLSSLLLPFLNENSFQNKLICFEEDSKNFFGLVFLKNHQEMCINSLIISWSARYELSQMKYPFLKHWLVDSCFSLITNAHFTHIHYKILNSMYMNSLLISCKAPIVHYLMTWSLKWRTHSTPRLILK